MRHSQVTIQSVLTGTLHHQRANRGSARARRALEGRRHGTAMSAQGGPLLLLTVMGPRLRRMGCGGFARARGRMRRGGVGRGSGWGVAPDDPGMVTTREAWSQMGVCGVWEGFMLG